MSRRLVPILLAIFITILVVSFVLQLPVIPPYDPFIPEPVPAPFPDLLPENITLAMKNETVYVSLDKGGQVKDQKIVNRIYGGLDKEATYIIDYGRYESVENLKGEEEPLINEDYLLWKMELLKNQDIYYEGVIEKELPVSITITYYLDGEETAPGQLAGKSGELAIVIETVNNLEREVEISYPSYQCLTFTEKETLHVPLLVQGSMEVDLNIFSSVESEEAMKTVIGQSKHLSFIAIPGLDREIRITMQGENIELEDIEFVVSPQIPPIPDEIDLNLEHELEAVLINFREVGYGLLEIYDGADQILKGLEQFHARAREIEARLELFKGYLEDITEFKKELKEELDILQEILDELTDVGEKVESKLEKFPDPEEWLEKIEYAGLYLEAITENRILFRDDLDELVKISDEMILKADELLERYEQDADLIELRTLLIHQKMKTEQLLNSYQLIEKDVRNLKEILSSLEDWEKEDLIERQEEVYKEFSRAVELLEQGKKLAKKLKILIGSAVEHKDDLAEINNILEQISHIPNEISRLVEGQRKLRDGIMALYTRGIRPIEQGIIEQINKVRYGEALAEELTQMADDYRSYADNNRNRYSSVTFIMQTEHIR